MSGGLGSYLQAEGRKCGCKYIGIFSKLLFVNQEGYGKSDERTESSACTFPIEIGIVFWNFV